MPLEPWLAQLIGVLVGGALSIVAGRSGQVQVENDAAKERAEMDRRRGLDLPIPYGPQGDTSGLPVAPTE